MSLTADDLAALSPRDLAFIKWQMEWAEAARPNQIPPEDGWTEIGYMAGRGFGKTRVGAEWMGRVAYEDPLALPRCVVAPTQSDVRFTCFEGESGLLNVVPDALIEDWNSTNLILTLVNGAQIRGFSAEKADRLRGPQHADAWCFIAGTLVETPDGGVPIEELQPGDEVLTRRGPRRVSANSVREADTGSVTFADGRTIVGTADHPVYTASGWTDLSALDLGTQVCAINVSSGADAGGTATEAGITSGRTRASSQNAHAASTARSGSQSAEPSPRDTTSTTSTTTPSTTGSKISSASRTERTERTTSGTTPHQRRTGPQPMSSMLTAASVERRCGGAEKQRDLFAAAASTGQPKPNAGQTSSANTAAAASSQEPETFALSVASTWQPAGRQSVYCLKVEGEPEYFANGVLVHNCDELAAWGGKGKDVWDMLRFGMRLGPMPRIMWTTTPKPVELVRQLVKPKSKRITVTGATFDNRANLPESFFEELKEYEGTKIGRQELYGELIDPEEAGIVKRSDFRLWPRAQTLPHFQFIVVSLDTAFTEKTVDKKGDPDPTACGVWGVFEHQGEGNVMLLDCWDEHLGFPALERKAKAELSKSYGSSPIMSMIEPLVGKPLLGPNAGGRGRTPDMLLIEDKGSGISLRQSLSESGIEAHPYNPGRADKLTRLHIVSPLFAKKKIWLPESDTRPGRAMSWTDNCVEQLCTFTGEGSISHDDHVDQTTQALRVLSDSGYLNVFRRPPAERTAASEVGFARPTNNPYAQ